MTLAVAATLLLSIKGMMVPESVYYHPQGQCAYVSNIVGEGWGRDSEGFITRLKADGSVDVLKWRTHTADDYLSAPKGMCVLRGYLYCADIDAVHRFALNGDDSATIRVPGAARLNDLATDGRAVYASDTVRGTVVRINPGTLSTRTVPAVPSINGITFHNGKLYAVSWDLHEVYELDVRGRTAPRPFGLARQFDTLDGIEALPDGGFVVSAFWANTVWYIPPDRRSATPIARVKTPADIGVDIEGGRLFVPQFYGDEVSVYSLR